MVSISPGQDKDKIIMLEGGDQSRQLIPCRVETKHPENGWDSIWSKARLQGLGPELVSFLFKVLHDLLPTQERLSRTSPVVNGMCKLCLANVQEDLLHALIRCPANHGIGEAVLLCLPIQNGV